MCSADGTFYLFNFFFLQTILIFGQSCSAFTSHFVHVPAQLEINPVRHFDVNPAADPSRVVCLVLFLEEEGRKKGGCGEHYSSL